MLTYSARLLAVVTHTYPASPSQTLPSSPQTVSSVAAWRPFLSRCRHDSLLEEVRHNSAFTWDRPTKTLLHLDARQTQRPVADKNLPRTSSSFFLDDPFWLFFRRRYSLRHSSQGSVSQAEVKIYGWHCARIFMRSSRSARLSERHLSRSP